ncbi:MAG: PASTA domain-containing protein [Actinobacteria bacterium]|nr:PASTA domain-containing protein [Actinomycetota bacterium]
MAIVASVIGFGLLGTAGTAAAAETVTVGTPLPMPTSAGLSSAYLPADGGFATLVSSTLSNPAVAPFSGTVIEWRIEGSSPTAGYSISVLHPNPDGSYTVTATSERVKPTGAEPFESFAADLPIEAGDYIALDVPATGTVTYAGVPSGSFSFIGTPGVGTVLPAAGAGKTPTTAITPSVFGYNVDIETKAPPAGTGTEPPPATTGDGTSTDNTSPASSAPPPPLPPAPRCMVPKLVGKKLEVARKTLRAAGCKVGKVTRAHGAKGKAARVIEQTPKAGAGLPAKSPVAIKVD